jgi:predicted Zn-dependent protease
MIEATCAACGTLNRVADANVPVGAKFITCADCKSRVAIAVPTAAALPKPPLPRPPPIPVAPPVKTTDVIDLADLPAPKRMSPLGPSPTPPAVQPAIPLRPMRSGLAAALDPQLPAPKPRPIGAPPSLQLDDLDAVPPLVGATSDDLVAPKRASARPGEPIRAEVHDLPTPRPGRAAPISTATPASVGLAAPLISDLPTPKRGPTTSALPSARASDGPRAHRGTDLPAPKALFDDLPGAGSAASGQVESGGFFDDAHLPAQRSDDVRSAAAPKGFFDDLPQPALAQAPELPAPKGFFDDLPQPALAQAPELPAPKGFFDDLPRPAGAGRRDGGTADLPAPKGFFDDLPGRTLAQKPELPAPQGYFDDLPGRTLAQKPELPAPQGYFDNLPAHTFVSKPELPAPQGYFDNLPAHTLVSKPELPAPQGFFDDLPAHTLVGKPELPAPQGFFDDLPAHTLVSKPELPAPQGFFENVPGRPTKKSEELAPAGFFGDLPQPARADSGQARSRRDSSSQAGVEIDFGSPGIPGGAPFDHVELSAPAPPAARFEPGQRRSVTPSDTPPGARETGSLEVEAVPVLAPARSRASLPSKAAASVDPIAAARARARRSKLVLGGVIAVAVLGGGGVLAYRRHAAAEERKEEITTQLQIARSASAAADAGHWLRAATAARRVIELDELNAEALGIGAEALYASALDDGIDAAAKIGQGRTLLDAASGAGISTPALARARALGALIARQPEVAIGQLKPLATAAPRDANLALYLGWALAAKGDHAGAITAYDRAASEAAVKLAALYGRGNARLELADLAGARADFSAALELARDHVGAQVGLAAALPPSAARRQEADLLAILARKDIANADPRAVTRAWACSGAAALRAGRLDVARERFHKALAATPQDLVATTGLAEVELRDGKLTSAAELLASALAASKDDVPAQLVQSEIEIKQNNLALATKRLAALASHPTPLGPREQARLHLVTGKLFEAQGKDDAAVESYAQGAKAAGDLDLTPLMAAVTKLTVMTQAAVSAKDDLRAADLRSRSELLLGALSALAERDPELAMTVGVAFLHVGNSAKAAVWLRRVVSARPEDADGWFQLGRALLGTAEHDEAQKALVTAHARAPARADIGLELARCYEALGRESDARQLYSQLLAAPDPSLELRGRAGRFYARTGELDKAGEQGALIVRADPNHAAGLYLKGEGLLLGGKPLDARQAFQRAVDQARDPLYLDALGRSAEVLAHSGDREMQDLALKSYVAASESAPTLFNALAGQGRLYIARHEAAKAITPLLAAARLDSKNPQIMFLIGAAYQELQQAQIALSWLEASARLAPAPETFWRIGQLYRDANKGAAAATALGNATRLAAEAEKRSGLSIPWLTDALYLQGRVNLDLHNEPAARDAWLLYVGRNPVASAQVAEVKQQLATTLRR